jgi:hypothetical protein
MQNKIVVTVGEITNTCFVVMPFKPLFDAHYERVIRPAVKEAGLKCVRGDEIYSDQAIIQDIWKSIRQARVVVAELSERNPNVLYEIGLAHAIGKPIILLTRNETDVPFDLKSLRYCFYDVNNPDWGDDLRKRLHDMLCKTLEDSAMGSYLYDIQMDVKIPPVPERILEEAVSPEFTDYFGSWKGAWSSVRLGIEHVATLTIAPNEKRIEAHMVVSYQRDSVPTVVQEILTGSVEEKTMKLTGVSYTYIERGNSKVYSLDSFVLTLTPDGEKLQGKVILKNGERDIMFQRLKG